MTGASLVDIDQDGCPPSLQPALDSSFAQPSLMPLTNHFPKEFISFILCLPTPAKACLDGNDEVLRKHAPKRRRVEALPTSSNCIARKELLFSRPCRDNTFRDFSQRHSNIGEFMDFSLKGAKLQIIALRRSPGEKIEVWFPIRPQENDQILDEMLRFTTGYRKKRSLPGAIWTTVELDLKQHEGVVSMKLSLQLFWNQTCSPFSALKSSQQRKSSERLINVLFSRDVNRSQEPWSPMDFYEAAHVPSKQAGESQAIDIPRLEATLFPYQKRSLEWLLRREGVRWVAASSSLEPLSDHERVCDLDTFRVVQDANGCEIYLSDVFQALTTDTTQFHKIGRALKGGLLAEEMGLGKTLEIIGLILLHERSTTTPSELPQGHERLTTSGATLIVTPTSLRQQWISELSRHAPALRVKDYTGRKSLKEEDEAAIVKDLAGYDVVITTYSVLSSEIHFASAPPERSRRYNRVYQRKTSPLVEISWWRVCLDEAQMIESGVNQAAVLAKLIPRINAWAITGTPVKDDVKDLRGLLSFLCYEPFCSSNEIWQALTTDHKELFRQLFNSISLRHTKALVHDEISLPAQKRYVISMSFTAVEEQHYQSLYKEMAEACNLDLTGGPLVNDWQLEDYEDVMRVWLNRLRQTILHPEVGVYGRRVLGNSKDRPMRTVEEVLNAMLEQSETSIRTDERALLSSKLFLGQLFENSPRVREALAIWEKARDEARDLVLEARAKLHEAVREKRGTDRDGSEEADDTSSESEVESRGKGRIGDSQNRLREALELHHRAIFFCANAYFQIRQSQEPMDPKPEEYMELKKLEDNGYDDAKLIRREILRASHRKATKLMNHVTEKAKRHSFTEIPEVVVGDEKGIESRQIIHDLGILYAGLNMQANVIDEWREQAIQLLLRPLIDEEEDAETTGEELAVSTTVQEEIMVYVQGLRALVADRQEAVHGQVNELIKYETKTALRLANSGEGPAPAKLLALFHVRDSIKPASRMSMRGILSDLRGLKSRLDRDPRTVGADQHISREALESKIATDLYNSAQHVYSEQIKAVAALESEVDGFSRVMNARLEYYRQLQAVSDGVLPHEGPKNEVVVARAKMAIIESHRKLQADQANHRYLLNLKEAGSSNEPRICVICQTSFTIGVLTVCGHHFCKECMMMWFRRSHSCPVCKTPLRADDLQDITIKPQELQVRSEASSRQAQVDSWCRKQTKDMGIYSEFNAEKLEELKNIELDGPSFTTKVDTLVRHILWLRESDPGAKSIVFSQYKSFLGVLQNAFRRFRIGFASVDEANGITRFKSDAGVECFLLHARAHSSGLNLVNASHVFLCEPLLNTALELQAIARVDRIGQQHETTVWLYIVSGTVEESIYNLSVRRRMEHMGRKLKGGVEDASLEEANTLEMETAALSKLMSRDRSAGEMVDHGDLWECLFGHRAAAAREADGLQERAVMSYLAGEAAEGRRDEAGQSGV